MRCRNQLAVALSAVLLIAAGASDAWSADPALTKVIPRGAQRGTEVVLSFQGARLQDAKEILFYDPGFEVVKLEPAKDGKSVAVTVKIAANCRLGEHVVHVRTASGLSEFRTLWIGPLPEVAEKEPNNDFEKPQAIPYGKTVTGLVTSEDVDYYLVEAKKGERITAEIEGLRLATQFSSDFDPAIAILDEERFELIVSDDTPLVHQDAVASIIAPKDGRYVIMVRDSAYGGNGNCQYRLHVGHFPRPLAVYPAGGAAGEKLEVTFLGDPTGPFKETITLPSDPNALFELIPTQDGLAAPSANPFRVSTFGNVLEKEPNGTAKEASGPAPAAPIALNGILSEEKDTDFLRFKGTKGQKLRIECLARQLRTPVDAVMSIHNAEGKALESSDDNDGPDPVINFTVPADGEYLVAVRDHLWDSGPEYVYRVEIVPQTPELDLSIPRTQRYQQDRQRIVIPRGGRYPTVINASRRGFGGEIVLEAEGLPKGTTMAFEAMASNLNSMPVVFEAASDAPLDGTLIDLKGFQKDGSKENFGRFSNTADMMHYRNNLMLWTTTVDRLAVAVVEKLPFSVKIVEPTVPLVREGQLGVKIVATRDEGFTKPITVEFPFRPPGVGTLPTRQIPEGKNEVFYPLNANENAQIGEWKVFAVAYADIGGRAITGTKLTTLNVADNNFTVAMERAAVIQGEPTEIFGKIELKAAFEGKATAKLIGLPNKVTAEPVTITKDTKEIRFPIKTDKASPVGRHKSVICEVTIPQGDAKIIYHAGTVELRIDAPPPEPKEKPKETKKAPPKKKTEKPLSRLEQLRLKAEQKRAAAAK